MLFSKLNKYILLFFLAILFLQPQANLVAQSTDRLEYTFPHSDEVRGAEHQVILGDANAIAGFTHCLRPKSGMFDQLSGSEKILSRNAAKRIAAVRSAVVPGFRRCPSARSHPSKSANADLLTIGSSQTFSTSPARLAPSSATAPPHFLRISESGVPACNQIASLTISSFQSREKSRTFCLRNSTPSKTSE